MCDFVSIWCQSVKLELNAIKSIFMVFSSLRNAPTVALEISNTVIPRSKSCLYLSITIDDKLSWDIHLSNKCIAVKRLLFLIYKCCCLTWGLSRSAISLLYKIIIYNLYLYFIIIKIISTILYNCVVWASDIRKKKVVAALCSAQRPFALAISRLFKSRQDIFYNLIEASNYLKIYVNLCRTGGIDVHQLFIETWSSDERKLVLEVLFSTFTIIFCKHDNLADELSSTVPMLRIELEEYIARVYKQPF